MFYSVKVKYTKQLDNGTFKRVSEIYLLQAVTFTDAESQIYEQLGSIIKGEFKVTGITPANIHELFIEDGHDQYFKVRLEYDAVSGDSEKSRKVAQTFIVSADNVKDAYERTHEALQSLIKDIVITDISLSPIVDIFILPEGHEKEEVLEEVGDDLP